VVAVDVARTRPLPVSFPMMVVVDLEPLVLPARFALGQTLKLAP
jgi:hypothetical protein